MSNRIELRSWFLAFAATAIMVALCILFGDRPAAQFFHQFLPFSALIWIDRILTPLNLVVPLALLSLLGCWIWVRSGHPLPAWTRTPLLCCWAAMWATLTTVVLKYTFGRGSPDPLFVQNHIYGFHFLDGGPHWHSFPSGTAAISTAILSVLWVFRPRSRALGATFVTLLCIAVVVNNAHWLADVIAGVFLGAFIGSVTVRGAKPGKPQESTWNP